MLTRLKSSTQLRCNFTTSSIKQLNHKNSGVKTTNNIGIVREDIARIWERRTPLIPKDVHYLTSKGIQVSVESCDKRIFKDSDYTKAGATIVDEIPTSTSLILGIKEIATPLLPNRTYSFFTHCSKGQTYNLPLLSSMIQSNSRFIDWELLTDSKGVRTTAFGGNAGYAGLLDGLSLLGIKALSTLSAATPFLNLGRAFSYRNKEEVSRALRAVGKDIEERGFSERLGPVTIVVGGKGRVGEGAMEVFRGGNLPCVFIDTIKELKKIVESKNPDLTKIYVHHLSLSDYLTSSDGKPFDREAYRQNPASFISEFHTKVAPYTTMFLNGGYWHEPCPRILTTRQLAEIQKTVAPNRMLYITDVSCDWKGSLEFVDSATTIDTPIYQFNASTGGKSQDPGAPGTTQISAIEIHPSQLPYDSSIQFSASILPYVESLLHNPTSSGNGDIEQGLRRATLVQDGQCVERFRHLEKALVGRESSVLQFKERRKKVVMLGSGLVASPAVEILAARKDIDLVIASNSLESAQALASGTSTVTAVLLDAADSIALEKLVSAADVVVSLLPAPLHVNVAKLCIKSKTSLVTASYVSKEMESLHEEAKAAGIVLLNELGLDPGIDHCSAMRLIKEAESTGNEITSFVSVCGGLTAPEDSNVPLSYKFSWSPRAVLTAALNPALFRLNGVDISIPSQDLLKSTFHDVPIIKGFKFQGIANRDSISYLKEYGLRKDLKTIIRGTLRYDGFIPVIRLLKEAGMMKLDVMSSIPKSWQDFGNLYLGEQKELRSLADKLAVETKSEDVEGEVSMILSTLQELGLTSSKSTITTQPLPPLPTTPHSPIDLLSILLSSQLKYVGQERDAVVLRHEVVTTSKEGVTELFSSTLVQYGIPGSTSAMATTVGMPIAIGCLLVLDNRITQRGIVLPSHQEVWKPLLAELDSRNVRLIEKRTLGSSGVLNALQSQASRWIDE